MDTGISGRQERGAALAAMGAVLTMPTPGRFKVRSQSNPNVRYEVNLLHGRCSCPDANDGWTCKHIYATEIVSTRKDADGAVTVERHTYTQEWSTYNRAACSEKDTFVTLLSDLCGTIEQPSQRMGRPRLPLSDMAFATTFKVYSRFSSRRFTTDLRDAHARGLITRMPHFNSVSGYLSKPELTPILSALIRAAALPLKDIESSFAVDASGFSTSRFNRWLDFKHGTTVEAKSRNWVKAHLMVGVKTNIVTAAEVTAWNKADSPYLPSLVSDTAENFPMVEISADKGYMSKANAQHIESVGATPFIPLRSRSANVEQPTGPAAWDRLYHRFMADRDTFMSRYHQRSNVESTFAMIKAKFGDSVLSKSAIGQHNEVLCKVLAHNVVVVGQAIQEFGIDARYGLSA